MSRCVRLLSVISCLVVWASAARADGVLLRQSAGLRDGLCVALRIQLTGVAEVRCEAEPEAQPLSVRIADASRRTAELGATLGALLERDPDPTLVRMYLVGARPAQAVIALERIEDRADVDVDRSLALEVQSALSTLRAAPPEAHAVPGVPLVRALVAPRTPGARWSLCAEAGGLLSVGALGRVRPGGGAALGVRVDRGALFVEPVLTGRLLSHAHARTSGAELEVDEWGLALEARAGHALGRASLAGLLSAGAERVHARGRARDGSTGGVRVAVPRLALGLDLRVRLLRGAALRLAPALELYPVRHRFEVDGARLGELGRVRIALPLSLVFSLPLDRGGPDHAR